MQELGIEPLMKGRDVVLAAETGSGKTLAYLLPIMTHILAERRHLDELNASFNDFNESEEGSMAHSSLERKPQR